MSRESESSGTIYRPSDLRDVETQDGSRTLYDPERDVHFSSLHGARTESHHIFLEGTGLCDRSGPWRVLELGFGAGINFRETARASIASADASRLEYRAVDYAPVAPDDVPLPEDRPSELVRELLGKLAISDPRPVSGSLPGEDVHLTIHPTDWRALALESFRADALFYDPFGPRREPSSWSVECFRVARRHMRPRAILGTYSAASDVKRAMFRAGLSVATAPGPGPKREITFAARREAPLEARPDAELLARDRYLDSDG